MPRQPGIAIIKLHENYPPIRRSCPRLDPEQGQHGGLRAGHRPIQRGQLPRGVLSVARPPEPGIPHQVRQCQRHGVPYPARIYPGAHPHRGRQAAHQRRFPDTPRKGTRGHAAPGRRPEHQPADAAAFPQGRRQADDGIRLPAVTKPSAQTVFHTAQHLPRRRPLRRRVLHEVRRPTQLRTAGDALPGRGGDAHLRSRPADMPRDARRGEGIRDGTQVRLFVERDRHRALQDRLFRAPAGAVAQRPRQGGRRHGQGASRG